MSGGVGLLAAYAAGLVSFLSPCVLPLVPAYLSFMTGMSVTEMAAKDRRLAGVLVPIALFALGFTVVFVALGASASALGSLMAANRQLLTRLAGLIVIVLGFVLLDVVPLPILRGPNVDTARIRGFGKFASFALGLVFPFALGPCAGPIYGAIITMAADTASVGKGALLLFVYSLGLATPFFILGTLFGRLSGRLAWLSRNAKTIDRVTGALLIVLGALVVTGLLSRAAVWLQRLLPFGVG